MAWRLHHKTKEKYSQKQSSAQKKEALQQMKDFVPFGDAEADRLLDCGRMSEDLKPVFLNDAPDCVFILTKEQ